MDCKPYIANENREDAVPPNVINLAKPSGPEAVWVFQPLPRPPFPRLPPAPFARK